MSQSLFYWIIYSYQMYKEKDMLTIKKVSILILLDYLFLWVQGIIKVQQLHGLNPYFIGLSILMKKILKILKKKK